MKKLLIMGSDFGSYDIVIEAHQMGIYVITTDLMETSPTKEVSDEAWLISTTDIEQLYSKCTEENISGIAYGATDFNATYARILCKRLGLPMIVKNDYAWQVACDKSEWKKVCRRVGVPVAKDYFLTEKLKEDELNLIDYPVVVKAVDLSANRGMSYCNCKEEVIEAYKLARSVSDKSYVICERQLHGDEWVANYILENGEARLLYFGRELHSKGEDTNKYSMIVTTANELNRYLCQANEKVKQAFKEAGFTNGIAWVETILDEDGNFYIIEPAYRFSSETAYKLYEKVSGFNSVRWVIENALGFEHDVEDLPADLSMVYDACVASYHLFAQKEGQIDRIIGLEEISKIEDVHVDLPRREGGMVRKGGIMGIVRAYGKNIHEVITKIKKINENFSVLDKAGKNMFIRYCDYDAMKKDAENGKQQFNSK